MLVLSFIRPQETLIVIVILFLEKSAVAIKYKVLEVALSYIKAYSVLLRSV